MISVVIPAKDPTDRLVAAVRSVRQLLPGAELIIVDDGSEPPIDEIPETHVVRQSNSGPGAARNRGAREATQDWLLFLDADDELLDGVNAAVDATRGGTVGLVCGATVVERAGRSSVVRPSPAQSTTARPRLSATAGAFLVRRDLFMSVGGYDEHLRFGENTDVIERCARNTVVVAVDSPMVKYNAPVDERRYDERRFRSAEYILRRDAHLDDRARARLHGIASVNASRVRLYRASIAHGWLALRAVPSLPALARLMVALTGPIGRRWWLRRSRSGSL